MPIYEFICSECKKKSEILIRDISSPLSARCPECGSDNMERVVSRFAYHQSEQMRRDVSGSPQRNAAIGGINDPRDIGRWTEDRLSSMGIDIRGGEHAERFAGVRDMIDKARDGDMSVLDKTED